MDMVPVVAITNVSFDNRRYRPGARFELPAPCAHALAASGNVAVSPAQHGHTRDDEEAAASGSRPADGSADPDTPKDPEPAADPDDGTAGESGAAPLEAVSGIGPSTAERLRRAGVADVAALAALTDERLAELRVRADWRDQARALTGAQ